MADDIFNKFYNTHVRRVLNYCICRGIPADDAKDVTHDIFLSVYLHRVHQDDDNQALPWLFRTTKNRIVSYYRSRNVRTKHRFTVRERAREWQASSLKPDKVLQQVEDAVKVSRTLEQTPEMVRKCLILRYYHHMSYDEMSDFLAISINTVKTHLKRGLKMMRKQLGEH